MTIDEKRDLEIDTYCMLQQIKHDNHGQENFTLEYNIKKSAAKLMGMGVNLEDLTIVD